MTAGPPERQASMARAVRGDAPHDGTALPRVRFVADLVCPWCWITFRRLRPLLGGVRFTWHPFLLNPRLPEGGVPFEAYLERSFGSLAQAQRVCARIQDIGAREGLRFAFGAIAVQPRTEPAHALVLATARAGGDPLAAAEALFRAFFEHGRDLGSPRVLEAVAREAGLPAEAPSAAADPIALAEVAQAHARACALGINGVPICVFGDDQIIAGAQPPEALAALLDLERYRLAAG